MKYPVFNDETERPLDELLPDGGFTAVFRTIGCVGDSLSSGEFQIPAEGGGWKYIDKYEYSWGQFIARMTGSKVYNFSRGGMTAKWYLDSFADENDFWNPDKKCQAYIIALGVNDLFGKNMPIGNPDKASLDEWENNDDSFSGCYATVIARLKKINPKAKFFLMTMPRGYADTAEKDALKAAHAQVLENFASRLEFGFVLDFYTYAPEYDKKFHADYYLNGHLNPMGYLLTAKMVATYIDYIIRHNPRKFDFVGLDG